MSQIILALEESLMHETIDDQIANEAAELVVIREQIDSLHSLVKECNALVKRLSTHHVEITWKIEDLYIIPEAKSHVGGIAFMAVKVLYPERS